MSSELQTSEAQASISQLYDNWTAAVRRVDIDGIVSHYTDDIVSFDAVLALQFKGKEAYRKHWQACVEMCPAGDKESIFELRDLEIQADDEVAFVHALLRCGFKEGENVNASWMRMSAGLRRDNGQWKIAHEHFSAPFEMPSGKAMFHLSPDEDGSAPRPIPSGMSSITAHLICADAPAAIDFYKKAFNAMETPVGRLEIDGKFMHGEIMIGDSIVMIGQEDASCGNFSPGTLKGTAVALHLYVPDVDAAWKQAISAGAKEVMPLMDMFWGDRYGVLEDPFGHRWSMATHLRDVPAEEIAGAAREFMSQAPWRKAS